MTPDVSVVIATRDRHEALARLLACVKSQDLTNFECIVVDDASTDAGSYERIWQTLDGRFRLLRSPTSLAEGPSRSRNRGIAAATAPLIAFCDDDDRWVRTDHLSTAVDAMRRYDADLYFANMQTSRSGDILGADFYGVIRPFLTQRPLGNGLHEVAPADRAAAMKHIFLHCDSLVASAALLREAGLFWEKLSMAEDRDLALRLLDRAKRVVYRDVVTADYDRTAHTGLCKAYTEDEIRQFVVVAMLHAETTMRSRSLRRVARGYRAWMLYELAQSARSDGRMRAARELALQSLLLRPTVAACRFFLDGRPAEPLTQLKSRPEVQ
jgi:glycosyltransferase involved in cell wall biosynthesis